MAKKTLLSENQVSNFMKLANIKQDRIDNFKKSILKENYGMGGTIPTSMEEDEPAADEGPSDVGDMGTGGDDMDMEPDAPSTEADFEGGADDFKEVLKDALREVLPQVMADLEGDEGGMEDEGDMDMDLASDEDDEMDMEDEGEEELDMEDEEEELQEAKHDKKDKKDTKKALKPKGGDAKKMKEALSFDNIDLVTDDEIINEVLKRVIRRIV